MFEKEAENHADGIYHYKINVSDYGEDGIINSRYSDVKEAYQKGAEFGYNKAMKEWRACFMSCSSPYCADKFKDVRCEGMLGNMTKEVMK